MLSAFTSGLKNLFFPGNSTDRNTRKRHRDENDEVDGEDFGDGVTASTPKKLKIQNWGITGMPPAMSKLISAQRLMKACPVIDENEVPSPADLQPLNRPPIHNVPSQPTVNGSSGCRSSGQAAEFSQESQPDRLREKTAISSGPGTRLYHKSQYPAASQSSAIPKLYSSSQRRETPAFTRFPPRQTSGILPHRSIYSGGGAEQHTSMSMYQKTFNPLRQADTYNGSLTKRYFSLNEKKRLAEKNTYRELLKQFSTIGFSVRRPPVAASTPYPQQHFTDHRPDQPHKRTSVRDTCIPPLIDLEKSKDECSINRTPRPGSRIHPKITVRSEKPEQLYEFHQLSNGDGMGSTQSPEKRPVLSKSQAVSPLAFRDSEYLVEDLVKNLKDKYSLSARERESKIAAEQRKSTSLELEIKAKEREKQQKIQEAIRLAELQAVVVEEYEEEVEDEFPALSPEMEREIDNALVAVPQGEILVQGYRLQITRKDLNTLAGLNWLNDEVINFYMNMLMERGEKDHPKVYAFTTFFYPKLVSSGHSSVRRWTRKTDVFANDYLLIPVHLGMHWCLAVVDFPNKAIRYFDSMGGKNTQCLNAIRQYLYEESLDKKKTEFDMTGWTSELVQDIPEQFNGSDCGMFACKYAEYVTRGAPITFTQEHMPYFRRRMVYEILKKQLL